MAAMYISTAVDVCYLTLVNLLGYVSMKINKEMEGVTVYTTINNVSVVIHSWSP